MAEHGDAHHYNHSHYRGRDDCEPYDPAIVFYLSRSSKAHPAQRGEDYIENI